MPEPQSANDAVRPRSRVGHRRSLPVYVGAGGLSTASHYAVTIAAVELFGVAPIVATVLGFLTGSAIKYWLNYSVAFRSSARHTHAAARFAVALVAMLAANTAAFAFFERGLGIHYIVAQALATILLILPGYVLHRQWVFR